MIGSLFRVMLFVKDVPGVAAFYRDVMGLSVIGEIDPEWTELDAGGCRIALHKAYGHGEGGEGSPVKIVFQCNDVPGTKAALEAKGVKMTDITAAHGVQYCDGGDPAGNRFQISNR